MSTDISEMFDICEVFYSELGAIEEEAAREEQEAYRRGIGAGGPSSPSRDQTRARMFLVQLFGFIAAVRSTKNYIAKAVARTPGQQVIRQRLQTTNIIKFHLKLANQVLHQNPR